jgi:hypothetical protein
LIRCGQGEEIYSGLGVCRRYPQDGKRIKIYIRIQFERKNKNGDGNKIEIDIDIDAHMVIWKN